MLLLWAPNAGRAQVAATRPPIREYVIGIGDGLDILVWGFPEFSLKNAEVRSDGKITFPMLGDVQAARLTTSMLKSKLSSGDAIGKYITNPNITITVVKSNGQIAFTINGQAGTTQRGATIAQLLEQYLPTLSSDPEPNLSAIKIVGVANEFTVDWNVLKTGKAPGMNISLEWGDEIFISTLESDVSPIVSTTPETAQRRTFTREELTDILNDVPSEKLELLLTIATPAEDGSYTLDLTTLSEEQRQQIGEDVLARLFPSEQPSFVEFTDMMLFGIAVDLTAPNGVVAFVAPPISPEEGIPNIRRVVEKECLEKCGALEDEMILQEINDVSRTIIVKKGEELQEIRITTPPSQFKLSGIRNVRGRRTVSFSNLPQPPTKKPTKWSFQQGDPLPDGSKIAQIADEWVLLQRDAAFELLLLRDSYQRAVQAASEEPLTDSAPEESEETNGSAPSLSNSKIPPEMLNMLPKPLQALNAFSKVFFATPVIE